jgi:hypothetical protein
MDDMTRGYLVCALWSSNDESDPSGGRPLDENYNIEDFSVEAVTKATNDCAAFRDQMISLDDREAYDAAMDRPGEWSGAEHMGHDFWLTRNGHGAGFWDRGLGELGERLSQLARTFGECDAYVGDDGRIYLS